MSAFPSDDVGFDATYAEESVMVDASEMLADLLETSGMSRADLARALGVSRGEITERLRGERNITVRKLAATVHALGHRLALSAVQTPVGSREDPYAGWAGRVNRQKADTLASHHVVTMNVRSNMTKFRRVERAS